MYDIGNNVLGENTVNYLAQNALKQGRAATEAQALSMAKDVRDQQLKGGTFINISPSIAYDTRDNLMDPTRGSFIKATAGPSVGIGTNFLKGGLSASKYKSFGPFTLASNVQTGLSAGGVPQFGMTNLGGWNGLRGYRQFSDLGSGSSYLMATAELRSHLPFLKGNNNTKVGRVMNAVHNSTKVALFSDIGGVGGNNTVNSFYSRSNFGASVGIGLRLNLPMLGLVRLDYGLPLVSTLLGGFTPRFTVGFGNRF
jgi:outer membrane protein assembly factor BamA